MPGRRNSPLERRLRRPRATRPAPAAARRRHASRYRRRVLHQLANAHCANRRRRKQDGALLRKRPRRTANRRITTRKPNTSSRSSRRLPMRCAAAQTSGMCRTRAAFPGSTANSAGALQPSHAAQFGYARLHGRHDRRPGADALHALWLAHRTQPAPGRRQRDVRRRLAALCDRLDRFGRLAAQSTMPVRKRLPNRRRGSLGFAKRSLRHSRVPGCCVTFQARQCTRHTKQCARRLRNERREHDAGRLGEAHDVVAGNRAHPVRRKIGAVACLWPTRRANCR